MNAAAPAIHVLDPGHSYELEDGHELTFIKREKVSLRTLVPYLAGVEEIPDVQVMKTRPGVTNESVLAALIDRTEFLDSQFPCPENKDAIALMRAALEAFLSRTAKRVAQGVEGKLVAHAD